MNRLKIFVSHSTEYKELAKSLKLSLQALEAGKTHLLDIKISDRPAELERAMKSITTGSLPPALPPFRTSKGIYIPVITKAESVDGIVSRTSLGP